MKPIVAVLLATCLIGAHSAAASPLVAPSNFQLGGLIEPSAVETAVDGFDESAWQSVIPESSPAGHMESEPLDEVGHQQPDDGDTEAGVAYPLTGSFTVGVSYGLEEMEDLSKGHIESGTVSEDYENHTVLLRANWRFN